MHPLNATDPPPFQTFAHKTSERRRDLFPGYKADRPPLPEGFREDAQNLTQLLGALRVPLLTAPGHEADDVLGCLAAQAVAQGARRRRPLPKK